jgi:hypothetical protein|tara:strand:- start:511 stop:948 length:438 start_codon:yes stop_codon:yes gene_type:complete
MNKDDKEAFAQKIAQQEDSGLTPDQKKLVEHVEQAIETNQSNKKFKNEYEYHKYWMERAQEAEEALANALAGDHRQKEADELMMRKLERIQELEQINEDHQKLNGKLQVRLTELEQENIELHADNKKLAQQVDDKVNQLRKIGAL